MFTFDDMLLFQSEVIEHLLELLLCDLVAGQMLCVRFIPLEAKALLTVYTVYTLVFASKVHVSASNESTNSAANHPRNKTL